MTEWMQSLLFIHKIIAVGLFAICYIVGGRRWKWVRRFLGSGLLGVFVLVLAYWQRSFSWWYFSYPLLLSIALCMGYGGNTTSVKIRRRLTYAIGLGLSCLPIAILGSAWILYAIQFGMCVVGSLALGVLNPMAGGAVDEEGVIAIMSICLVPFMVPAGSFI